MATDRRQSTYPLRNADIHDNFILAENPDPAGDESFAARNTAQTSIRSLAAMIRRSVASSGTVQAVNGEIVPVDSSSAAVTIEAPTPASPGTFFGLKHLPGATPNAITVQDTANGYQIENPYTGAIGASLLMTVPGESIGWTLFERSAGTFVWLASGFGLPVAASNRLIEIWTVPVNTNASQAGGPLPLTFLHNGFGSPYLFTEAGGVLTAQLDIELRITMQFVTWITLGSNNNSANLLIDPVTTATGGFLPNCRASQGASRAESFPNTVNSDAFVLFQAGDTFQINSTLNNVGGTNTAQLGNSANGDTYGGYVEFSV